MSETNYVCVKSERNLYTVGFYRPDGRWEAESDWTRSEDAAAQVHYLNGGQKPSQPEVWPPRYGKTESHLSPEKIADGAIEMFLEYRDKHGKTEEEARACAIQEVMEGIAAIEEMKASEPEIRAIADEQRRYGTWHGKYRVDFMKDQEQGIEI